MSALIDIPIIFPYNSPMDIFQTLRNVFDLEEIVTRQMNATAFMARNIPDEVRMTITVVAPMCIVFNYLVPGDHDFSQVTWHPTHDEAESLCDLEGMCAHILEEVQTPISGPWNPLDPKQFPPR